MSELVDQVRLLGPAATPGAISALLLVLVVLWGASTRRLRARTHLLMVLAALLITVALRFGIDVVWRPVADGFGWIVWAWTGAVLLVVEEAIAACALGSARARRGRSADEGPRSRPLLRLIGALTAVTVAAGAAGVGLNAHFAAYYTLGSALGLGLEAEPLADSGLDPSASGTPITPDSSAEGDSSAPLETVWTAPDSMPVSGRLFTAPVPASDPVFRPRDAWIYVPPAALVDAAPRLPLLVLMAGQPGEPKQWFTAGRLKESMDAWAGAHAGLAPIVLVVDPLGSALANPLCSDAVDGEVATYIERDVPAWAAAHLPVSEDHARWAIGGLSNGGTCTLQVVARSSESPVYRSFLSMSSELHPSLGSVERTIAEGFGGDRAAYEANDPLVLFSKSRYFGVAGILSVGAEDSGYRPGVEELAAAAKRAGLEVELRTYPGGHSWSVWSQALPDQLDWLGRRLGLTA